MVGDTAVRWVVRLPGVQMSNTQMWVTGDVIVTWQSARILSWGSNWTPSIVVGVSMQSDRMLGAIPDFRALMLMIEGTFGERCVRKQKMVGVDMVN